MRPNLFFFTGPDNYFLRQELTKWTKTFGEKFGIENCVRFTCDSITPQALAESLQGGGFFATKKMIICDGIPEDKVTRSKAPAAVVSLLEGVLGSEQNPINLDTILIFVSIDPDKRSKLYKLLTEKAQPKSFAVPTPSAYTSIIRGRLGDCYTDDIKDHLLTYVGSDTARLVLECDKIQTYMHHHQLTSLDTATLSNIVYSGLESNSFVVLDGITSGKESQALRGIAAAAHDESNRNEFLGMLYRGLKHTLLTIDLYTHGVTQSKDIASAANVQPSAVTKNLKYIDSLIARKSVLLGLFHDCITLDAGIKSGRISQEAFRAEIATRVHAAM